MSKQMRSDVFGLVHLLGDLSKDALQSVVLRNPGHRVQLRNLRSIWDSTQSPIFVYDINFLLTYQEGN